MGEIWVVNISCVHCIYRYAIIRICIRFYIVYNLQRDISTWTVAWTIEIQSIWIWYHIITCINRSIYIYIHIHAGMYCFRYSQFVFHSPCPCSCHNHLETRQVNMMAELPSNVFLAEEFLEYFAPWQHRTSPKGNQTRCWENLESRLVWEKCWGSSFEWILCVCVCVFCLKKRSHDMIHHPPQKKVNLDWKQTSWRRNERQKDELVMFSRVPSLAFRNFRCWFAYLLVVCWGTSIEPLNKRNHPKIFG